VSETEFEFDQDFEDEILAQCFLDSEYMSKASDVLDAHHFSTEQHSWIWKVCRATWFDHNERVTARLLLNEARSEFPDDDEKAAALQLVAKLMALKPESPKAALGVLTEFVRFVKMQTAGEQMARKLEKGDVDGAYEEMGQIVRSDSRPTGFEYTDFISGFADRLKTQKLRRDNPDLYPVITTGLKKLDNIIDGIRQQELGLLMATTGRGKSILCVHLGYNALKAHKDAGIVHFSYEMHHSQVAMRYDARWSGLQHRQFKTFDFTSSEIKGMAARLLKIQKQWEDRLMIVSAPVRSATLQQSRQMVAELQDKMEAKVRMVIMDSGDHLMPDRIYRDGGKRHEHADIYWGMKGWAEEDDVAIWSSTQAGKQAADRVAKAEDASEAYEKSRIASIVLSLNSPSNKTRSTPKVEIGEDTGDENAAIELSSVAQLELFLTKYRDGEGNIRIPLETDLARMIIKDGAEIKSGAVV
jgi:replicative DNA helicase